MRFISPITTAGLSEINAMIGQLNYTLEGLSRAAGGQSVFVEQQGNLVWEKIVDGANEGSMTTDSEVVLDGDAHGGYTLDFFIVQSSGVGNTGYSIYANNDTNADNYRRTWHRAGASGSVNVHDMDGVSNIAQFSGGWNAMTSGTRAGRIQIMLGPSSQRTFIALVKGYQFLSSAEIWMEDCAVAKASVLSDNLTRLDFLSNQTGAFGVGSWFKLYRNK